MTLSDAAFVLEELADGRLPDPMQAVRGLHALDPLLLAGSDEPDLIHAATTLELLVATGATEPIPTARRTHVASLAAAVRRMIARSPPWPPRLAGLTRVGSVRLRVAAATADAERLSALLPADHPDRISLAWEVHARPPDALTTPSRATYVAVLVDGATREQEQRQLRELCRALGSTDLPKARVTTAWGSAIFSIKWERHGEFSGYTFVAAGTSATPFGDPPAAHLPHGWLAPLPGQTIFAANADLIASHGAGDASPELLKAHFGENVAIGSIDSMPCR